MVDTSDLESISLTPGAAPVVPGLVLSGGGARGAYQAGVLRGIAEITKRLGIAQPFPIITGVSAGAINASFLATGCDKLGSTTDAMAKMWSQITAEQIFRTDAVSAGRSGLKLLSDAALGALYHRKLARALLETTPLREFLSQTVEFARIREQIQSGNLQALAVTAMNYSTATSITFVQGKADAPMWQRSRRVSQRAEIDVDHVMASAAIPLFFPPVAVGDNEYGDGCLRNTAPLSPAIHLGANRLLVISVRRPDSKAEPIDAKIEPSMARVLGVILNALLLDAVDVDMERMSRVNQTIDQIESHRRTDLNLRKIDFLWLRPSRDIGNMAAQLHSRLPRVIRYLMGGLGSTRESSELTSYLLFDSEYCGQLVELGFEDALAQHERIERFFTD